MKSHALFLTFAAFAALASCSSPKSDYSQVTNSKFLNVGITIYEPMDYFDEDGETIVGFDASLARDFAKSLGATARFTLIAWDSKILELSSGAIDVIWNGMTITDELKSNIDVSTAYATNYQCVVVKESRLAEFTSPDSLKTFKVAVEAGSAGADAVKSYVAPIEVRSQEAALLEVKSGSSDAAVIDVTMANAIVGKADFTGLAKVAPEAIAFDKEDFGVGLRKGSDLTSRLNTFLKGAYADGSMAKLSETYGVALNDATLKA